MRKILLTLCIIIINIAASAQTKTGTIRGVVVSKDSSTPVPYATVVVENMNEKGAVTDENGEFTITDVRSGYRSVLVTVYGFTSYVSDKFLVSAAKSAKLNIELSPILINIEEVVITTSPYRNVVEFPVSNYTIRKQEIEKSPGANRDISKAVQISPGVITSTSNRNDLLVRGGGSNENVFYLDGVEIPVINHFAVQGGTGGSASLVNTDFLSGATFYTSGFPVTASGALSSVLDMELNEGNSEKFSGQLTVGASDLGFAFDTPISRDGRTTMLGSYRRSYLQLLFSMIGLPFLPVYNDYQLKVKHKFDDKNSLTLLMIGSFDTNRLNTDIEDPSESQSYILGYIPENDQNSYTVGLVYDRKIDSYRSLKLVLSRNYFKDYLYKYQSNDPSLAKIIDIDSREVDNRFRAEYNFTSPKLYRFLVGSSLDYGDYRSSNYQAMYVSDDKDYYTLLNKVDYGVFGSVSKSYMNGHLSMSLGVRADGSSYSKTTQNPLSQISPRFGIIYRPDDKWSIKGYLSKYYALPSYTTLGYSDDDGVLTNKDNDLKYIGTAHAVAGVSFSPNSGSKITVEGFYKKYTNYPVSLVDSLPISTSDLTDYTIGDVPVSSTGEGRAYGAEFSYRNSSIKNTVINLSYTFLHAEYNLPGENLEPTSTYIASGWDIRHMINAVGMYSFGKGWDIGLKWRYSSGAPYSPYDKETSSLIEAWDSRNRPYTNYDLYNAYRYEPYHQLDLRIDKSLFFDKWSASFYIDVQNIYNYQAYDQDLYLPVTDDNGNYVVDPNDSTRYLMKEIESTFNGTVVPTIGVIIQF